MVYDIAHAGNSLIFAFVILLPSLSLQDLFELNLFRKHV